MAFFEHTCFLKKINNLKYKLFLLTCIGRSLDEYDGADSLEDVREQIQDFKDFNNTVYKEEKDIDIHKEIRENLVTLNENEAKRYYRFLQKYIEEGKQHYEQKFTDCQSMFEYAQSLHPNGIDFLRSLDLESEPIVDYSQALDYFYDRLEIYIKEWIRFLKSIEGEFSLEYKMQVDSEPNKSNKATSSQKLIWKGELKEFAELIDQLEKKGWVNIHDRELKPTIESLCRVLDFSATKKKEDSNTENSLMQYLKPSERENKIYTKTYNKKFGSILPNSNQKLVTK